MTLSRIALPAIVGCLPQASGGDVARSPRPSLLLARSLSRKQRSDKAPGRRQWSPTRRHLLLLALVALCLQWWIVPAVAQLSRPFTIRFTANDNGDILHIGNTLASCLQGAQNAPTTCAPSVPINGTGSTLLNDNNYNMVSVNVAGGTVNSSSAQLTLPPGATVLWAGLYWSAHFPALPCDDTASPTAPCRRVRFATPTTDYVLKTGNVDVIIATNDVYQGFVEVTTDVQAGGSGTYRVADVVATTGNSGIGFWAGWALLVVIQDPAQPLRNLTVFDGFAMVNNANAVNTTVSGFLTPRQGVFTTRMGTVVWDGDRGGSGDSIRINGVSLSDATSSATDFFNGTIAYLGVPVTTKNPNFVNQLGLDIDVVNASGILPNGATSAALAYTSTSETIFPSVLTFLNDVFVPIIEGNVFKSATDVNGGTVDAGDVLEYTIAVSNTGNDASINQVLTDPMPANATYVPGSLQITAGANAGALTDAPGDDQAEFTGSSVLFRLGTGANAVSGGRLDPGETTTLTFQVQINPAAPVGTIVSNQGVTTYNGETLGTAFTSFSDSFTVPGTQPIDVVMGGARANLSVSKISAPNPVVEGQDVTYTLTVTNAGPSNAAAVTLDDVTPANTTFRSTTASPGWTVAAAPAVGATGTVTYTHASLPPGTSTVTLVVRANAGTAGTSVSNTAVIMSPTDPGSPHLGSTTTAVIGPQDLAITKTVPALTGRDVTYTLTVTNPGPASSLDVAVNDPLPTDTTFLSTTAPAGWSVVAPAVGSSGTVTFANPNLPPGTYSFTLMLRIANSVAVGTVISNTATVTSTTSDPNTANNTSTATTTLSGPRITKSFSPIPVIPNQTSTLTIILSNLNPFVLTGAAFTDTLPAGVTTMAATAVTTCGGTVSQAAGSVGLTGGTIPANGTCTVAVNVTTTTVGNRTNTIPVGGLTTTNGGANTILASAVLTTVGPGISKTFTPNPIVPGGTSTLTIILNNPTTVAMTGAAFTDTFPAGMIGVLGSGATTCGGTVTVVAASVGLTGGAIPATGTCTVTVNVTTATSGNHTNTIAAGGLTTTNAGSNTTAATASLTTTGFVVSKSFASDPIQVGGTSTLTITFTNATAVAITGVAFTDTFPAGMTGVLGSGATTCGGTVTVAASVALSGGTIAGSSTCTVTVNVTTATTGARTNTILIGGVTTTNGGSNTAAATDILTTVRPVVTKSFLPDVIPPGGTSTLTIFLRNAAVVALTGAAFTDTLPAGMTTVAATAVTTCGGTVSQAAGTVNLSGGTIAATGTCTVTVNVTTTTAGSRTNTIAAGGLTTTNGGTNAAAGSAILTTLAPPTVAKGFAPGSIASGGTSVLTITLANANTTALVGATFTDFYPVGLVNAATPAAATTCTGTVSATPGASTVSLNGGTVPASGSCTVTVTVTAPGGTYANTIPVGDVDTANGGSNTAAASATLTVALIPPTIAKSFSPTSIPAGGTATLQLSIGNPNFTALTGVAVSDPLPAGMQVATPPAPSTTSCGTPTFAPTAGATSFAFSNGTVSPGGICTITVDVTSTTTGNAVNTTGTVTSANGGTGGTGTATLTVTPAADLAVTKTDGATTAVPGASVTYTIVASSNGPSNVTGATVTDTFPVTLTGVAWTCAASAGSTCPASGSGNINAPVNLLAGGTATFAATGTIAPGATGTLANTASVTVPGGVTDPSAGNNSDTDTDTLTPQADLVVTKTDGAPSAVPGTVVTYTIVATNTGPSTVTGATVTDTFAATLTGVTWTCVASAGSTCAASGSGDMNETVTLRVNGTATFTVTATIAAGTTGTLANTASITAPAGVTDADTTNNSATDTDTLTPRTDLQVTKTNNASDVIQGGMTTYTIVVTNNGPSDVVGATVSDPIPTDLSAFTWTCTASSGSSCPANGTGALTNVAVNLLQNGTATFTLGAAVNTTASGTITNTASVAVPGGVTDPVGGNNLASDVDAVTPAADIVVTKTVSDATPNVGDTFTFTVTVLNSGPSDATGIQLSDGVPAGLTLLTATPSQGTYTAATGVWDIGAIAVLGSATLTLAVDVDQVGAITNIATKIAGDQFDPDTSNNASGVTLTGQPSADIQVQKAVDNAVPNVGSTVTFTVTATNAGPTGATSVALTDALPSGLTLVTAMPSQGTYSAGTGVWDIGAVALGASVTLTLQATVTQAGTITNSAAKTAQGEDDPVGANDASGVTINGQEADVQVVKTVDNTVPLIGEQVTFTVTVSNNGPSAATGVAVTDQLPAGLTLVTATPSQGTYTAVTGVWGIGVLASSGAGAMATLQLTATVTQAMALTNMALKTAQDQPDPNPANDQGSIATVGQPVADLRVTKTDGASSAVPGTAVTYTIEATNLGPSVVSGATVTDTFPARLNGVTWTCVASGGSTCPASGSGDLNEAVSLGVNGTATFTVTATVAPGATGTLDNTASITAPAGVTDPTPGNNSATDTNTLTPQADLQMTKTDGASSAVPGTVVTYTMVATNTGPSTVTGATVTDTFPASLTGVTWTCVASAGSTCAASGSGDLNEAVSLRVNGTATFTVMATVATGATGTLANTASIAVPSGVTDPDTTNNSATDANVLTPQVDLAIAKTDGVASAVPGTAITYTIVATNFGPSAVIGATVTDTFATSLTGVAWTCVASAASTCAASGSGDLNEAVSLRVNGTATFTVTATIATGATGTLANTAIIAAPSGVTELDTTNNSDTDTNTLMPQADLVVTKTDGVPSVVPGAAIAYTIVATNTGPSAVTGATVTDTFAASLTGVTWTCVASGGSTCPASGSGNLNEAVSLRVNGTATFTVMATVAPGATGTLVNTASITTPAGVTDPDATNNSATDSDALTPQADLGITKTDGVPSVVPGTTVTYTIEATNLGPSVVTGATVTDTFAARLTGVTWTCTASAGSTCAASGSGDLNETVTLRVNGTATFTITATVVPGATGTMVNTASVTAPAGVTDPDTANNSATDTNTLVPQADLQITKTNGAPSAIPGASVTYTIVATNPGPSSVTGATVTDTVPAALTGVTWTCTASAGSNCPGNGTDNISALVTLIAGGTATFTLTGTIAPGTTGTLVNTASITAPAGVTDPNTGNNSDTDTDTLTPEADLDVTKTTGGTTVVPGTPVTYTIVVTNQGPSQVTGATVTDTVPSSLTNVTWTCVASAGSTCPATGTGDINTAVSLTAAGTATFILSGLVVPGATGSLVNTVSVTAPAGVTDPTAGNNSATDTDPLTPQADLAVAKSNGTAGVIQGGLTTYTVVVSNAGPSDVTDVTVSDALPTGLSTFAWTCVPSAASVCPASGTGSINTTVTLLGGGTATFTVQAAVRPTASGTITNTVSVTAPSGVTDPAPGNNSVSETDVVIPAADVNVTKTVDNATPNVGDTVTFTVTVTNSGPSDATGVQLGDGVPAGLSLVAVTPSQGTYTAATGVWDVGTVLVAGTATLMLAVDVDQVGTITNVATKIAGDQFDPDTSNNAGGVALIGEPSADIQVHKTADNVFPNVGSTVTYTITTTNAGPTDATGVQLVDVVPVGLTLVTATPSQGTYTAATGLWDIGAVSFGVNATLTLQATVQQAGVITNSAAKTAQGEHDPVSSNDVSGVTINGQEADVQVVKTVDNTVPLVGEDVTFTVTVTNNGPSNATGVVVTDQLTGGLTLLTATPSQGTYTAATGLWAVGALDSSGAGGTATLQLTATVTEAMALTNVAVKSAQDQPDPNPANDQGDIPTVGQPLADLAIMKTDGATRAVPGTPVTYTLVVSNAGPSPVTGVMVNDVVPVALTNVTWTCVASVGANCSTPSGTGDIHTTVALVAGSTATLTLTGTVQPGATGTLANTASVTVSAGVTDPQLGNNSTTDTNTLTPQADLSVTKSHSSPPAVPGQAVTYTIVATNSGPSAVIGATVTDTFPATLTGVTWSCAASTGSNCPATGSGDISALVDLVAGGTATFTATGTVAPGATGTLANTARVTVPAGVTDPNGGNDSATDSTTLAPQANLRLTKSNGATSVVPGTSVTYTIVATNTGPSAVTGATVTDTFPAALTGVTWSCAVSTGSTCPATGTGNLNALVDLATAGIATFTVTATVSPDATGTLVNTASITVPGGITDPNISNNSAADTDTLTPRADLALTKTNGATTNVPGQGVTYTIVATNNGPSVVTGATVVDTFPATVLGVAWTCTASTGSTCLASGAGNISTVVDLAIGGTATFTATGTITPGATGTLANTASITVPSGVTDPNAGNDSVTVTDTLMPEADLTMSKTDGATEVFQGGLTTYTIVVTNQGPSDVTGASFSDPLPTGLDDFNWTCTASAGSLCPTSGIGAITAAIDLLRNGMATFTVLATVNPAATGTIRNQATVTAPTGTTDPIAGNNTARDTNTVNPTADVSVVKTVDNATPNVGDTVTFTVTVRNQGLSDATGVQISDGVTAGLTLLTPTPSQGTYTQATGVWDVGALSNGALATLTLEVRVEQVGVVANVATKTAGDQFDPDTSNNTSGADLTGQPSADVQVHKTVDNVLPNVGRQVTFTVTVTNAGPSDATDVQVTDTLPAGLTLLTATPSQGTYTAATGVWDIGAMTVNRSMTLTVVATVDQAGVLINTAAKTAQGENDPAGSNDASGVAVNGQSADVQVVKTVDNTVPLVGDTITFTVTVSNNGPSATTGVNVLDQLSTGLTSS